MTDEPISFGEAPQTPKRKSLHWLWVGCGAVMLGGIIALSFGLSWLKKYWDIGPAARALDADVVAAKAAGVPLEAKEIAPDPPVKPEENAAPLLLEAATLAEKLSNKLEGRLSVVASDGSADPAEAEAILASQKRVLDLAEQAAAKPLCDFNRDWDMGPALLFPELAGSKKIVKLLVARADLSARKGDHAAAVNSLVTANRIGLHVASDPVLIPQLVSVACQSVVLAGAERCMALAKDPNDLAAYATFLANGTPNRDVLRTLKGEAFNTVATLRNLRAFGGLQSQDKGLPPVDPATLKRSGMPEEWTTRAYMARNLEMWTQILTAANKEKDPGQAYVAAGKVADKFVEQPGVSYLMVKILAPMYTQMGDIYRRDQVQWRVAEALARVLLFNADHGRFPKDLAEIQMTSADPFGKNLLYKTDGRGVKVYSVGPDGKDDGGKQRYEVKLGKGETWDIVASYPPSWMRDSAKILLKR